MQKSSLRSLATVSGALICVLVGVIAFAQTIQQPPDRANTLKKFLRSYVGQPSPAIEQEAPTSYSAAYVDLRDDGAKEIIVYISGRGWCGTGGCTMLILISEGSSYKVVNKTTVTRLPIRMLAAKSNGWHDLAVVTGGGGMSAHEARLCFDGEGYPSNPSIPPARPLGRNAKGKIAIPVDSKGEHLYE